MMKTQIVLVRAVELNDGCRGLTPLGDLQARLFAEAMAAKGLRFTHTFAATGEPDSWATAHGINEAMGNGGLDVKNLRELAVPESTSPRGAEIISLLGRYPEATIPTFSGDPGYQALSSHTVMALRELRRAVSPEHQQTLLICSRHGHILNNLALHWVSEMIFAQFRMCYKEGWHLSREEFCSGATEFFLEPGQGLMFRYDASDPADRMVSPIVYLNPQVQQKR